MIASKTRIYSLVRAYVLVMGTSDANEAESGDLNWVLEDHNAGRSWRKLYGET